jgi:thiamine biosynthesis lipoprotein
LTGGAFDVTVQPLWQLYAEHFAANPDDSHGPSPAELSRACSLVDFRQIEVSPGRIRIPSGMAVTLNGIAQGYITDRVADLLQARGWTDMLIDLGELRGLGSHAGGRPWTIGLPDPRLTPATMAKIPLGQRAAATSAGRGTAFDRAGLHHHLFVPWSGRSAGTYSALTVLAGRASVADALSTALSVMPREQVSTVLRNFPRTEAWIVTSDGRLERLGSAPA